MRLLAPLAAAAAALLACGHDERGSADGAPCGTAADCRSGLCFRRACTSALPPSPSCTPPGAPAVVLGAPIAVADPGPGACVTAVRDPVPASEYLDLGDHAVGTQLSFAVPSGTARLSILMQAVGSTAVQAIQYRGVSVPNGVVPTDVTAPDGTLFYSDTEPLPAAGPYADLASLLAFAVAFAPVTGAFTIPSTSTGLDRALTAGELPPGTWTFRVNDYAYECLSMPGACSGGSAAGTYRVQVLATPRAFASTGTLDLEVYLATSAASQLPGAAAAVADPRFARWAQGVAAYFARAGICLGTVTVHDLPTWAKSRYVPNGVLDVSGDRQGLPAPLTPACSDFAQLFALAVAPSRAVHLFLADALVDRTISGDFTVLGQDGTIPGPSGLPGTITGGAVLGVFDLLGAEAYPGACAASADPSPAICGTDWLSIIAAHEAGHWLGLFHTTEATGDSFDPLWDTPACPCLACAPAALRGSCAELRRGPVPTVMWNAWCTGRARCGGGRNLMFWLFDPDLSAGELTREQGDVMRLNPAVR